MSITGLYNCPACNHTVTVRSSVTNVFVCPHCKEALEKNEAGSLQKRPHLNAITDHYAPVQIGTCGKWEDQAFEIIGRIRCLFAAEGYLNLWVMHMDGGSLLLLAESFGELAVYRKIEPEHDVAFARIAALDYGTGTANLIGDRHYILEQREYCYAIEAEGEAWVYEKEGAFDWLQMAAKGGGRLALLGVRKQEYVTFFIHYTNPKALELTHMRNVEGDSVRKELSCDQCHAAIKLYSWPMAQSYTCPSCGGLYAEIKGVRRYQRKLHAEPTPAIALYTQGTIRKVQYRLVGFMEKKDAEGYQWREYTLFNALDGYAFLSEYNGHWIFLKETGNAPVLSTNRVMEYMYEGRVFELYNQYPFTLVNGRGEFPGDVHHTHGINSREYIAPPEIWVRELGAEGFTWFHGEHISGKELQAAFGNAITLPPKEGVGAVQPVPGQVRTSILSSSILVVILVFLFLFLFSTSFNKQDVVYENTFTLPDTTNIPTIVTNKFILTKWRSNLEFAISSPLTNAWFEAGITLVNADNGKEYSVEKGIEEYSGVDDGEYWKEGSNHDEALLHSIPAGTYFLQIDASRDNRTVQSFGLVVTNDVPMWRNFFIFVLLALAPAIVLYARMYYQEGKRWENSPFSSTNNNDD